MAFISPMTVYEPSKNSTSMQNMLFWLTSYPDNNVEQKYTHEQLLYHFRMRSYTNWIHIHIFGCYSKVEYACIGTPILVASRDAHVQAGRVTKLQSTYVGHMTVSNPFPRALVSMFKLAPFQILKPLIFCLYNSQNQSADFFSVSMSVK